MKGGLKHVRKSATLWRLQSHHLCLLPLPMSNPFFLRRKIEIPSRHQINKPNLILPEIRNFCYHAASYSSPFWCTQSKGIWENIWLRLCDLHWMLMDLHWMPVSCWEDPKVLDLGYKVLDSFGPGRCGEVTYRSKMWRFIKTIAQGVPSKESFILEIIFHTSLTCGHAVKPLSPLWVISADMARFSSIPAILYPYCHVSTYQVNAQSIESINFKK